MSMHEDPPILVCADLQTEYLTEGRSHLIADADAITSLAHFPCAASSSDQSWPQSGRRTAM